ATFAGPLPLVDTGTTHGAEEAIVQGQPASVAIVSVARPPAAGIVPPGVDRLMLQPRPSCVRSIRWSLIVTLPVREAESPLAAAVTLTVAAPCPEVVASFSHEAWLSADQVQSRAALTDSAIAPPSAGTTDDEVLIDAAQRTVPGPA